MLKSTSVYIDLGTTNTTIYIKGHGVLFYEPSLLAMKKISTRNLFLAHGKAAKLMLGKTPLNSEVFNPLHEGVISDFERAAEMLHSFFKRLKENVFWLKPRILISLPCKVTEHEKAAVEEIARSMGASTVHLLEEPIAAALGSDLPILEPRGQMIVDIGGGTTEVAVLSLGGIVSANAIRMGGLTIDDAIIRHLKQNFHFVIGAATAEKIKSSVGMALIEENKSLSIDVGGLDLKFALPRKLKIDSQMIFPVIDKFATNLSSLIKKSFQDCPEELAGDLAENGITLAGGGALLKGLSERLHNETGVPVKLSPQPLTAVAKGGALALENNRIFNRLCAG